MVEELILVLKRQRKGTGPHLNEQKKRFAEAARKCALQLSGSKLKGADKVRAFNQCISEALRKSPASL